MRKKNPNKVSSYLIELPICNLAKCKIKFTGHRLQYSTTPNLPTLFSQSSQSKNLALIFLLQSLPGHCLCSNSDHKQVFTPIMFINAPNNVTTSTKMHRYSIPQPI